MNAELKNCLEIFSRAKEYANKSRDFYRVTDSVSEELKMRAKHKNAFSDSLDSMQLMILIACAFNACKIYQGRARIYVEIKEYLSNVSNPDFMQEFCQQAELLMV